MLAERSISVLTNMLEDIKKIWFVSLCIVQGVFIVSYIYSIYSNINNIIFLIIYSLLFMLSCVSFALFLIKHKSKKKISKNIYRTKNFVKYIINAVMLIVNIIEMIKFQIDDFSKILLAISGISLFVQVLIEFIKIFADKYITDLKNAFEKDFELLNLKKWKSNALKIIDAPLEKLAMRKEGKERELSKDEIRLENHKKRYEERKAKKNEEAKKQEKLRISHELNKIKTHVRAIFRKKNKKEIFENTEAK